MRYSCFNGVCDGCRIDGGARVSIRMVMLVDMPAKKKGFGLYGRVHDEDHDVSMPMIVAMGVMRVGMAVVSLCFAE